MPAYPDSQDDRTVGAAPLTKIVVAIFEQCGMPAEAAALLADTLVTADLRGCHSHGVLRVPEYAEKLLRGGVDPRGQPSVIHDRGSALVIDGGNSMGQVGCCFAMQQALRRAERTGVAIASLRGSNHCGAMAYFAMQALAQDMIGLAATNALPTMAPWGGCEKIIGINPLAVAVPAGRQHPIVLDAAFSGSSHGKIRVYDRKGLPIPENWAFDSEGRPTTNAANALDGLLQPIGEYKGTGLAVIMGILSSVLSGACYGTELGNMVDGPKPGADGQFLMAIKVAAFEELDRFKSRIDSIVTQIRESRPADAATRIYAPGELEAETEQRYRHKGIPLDKSTVAGLTECGAERGIDVRALSGS